MNNVKKVALILLIWLFATFFISVVQTSPITISLTTASFFQIPVIFWLVILVSPFLLYIIAKNSKNPLVPLLCVTLYFFLFYSYGLYFMSHPTTTDVVNAVRFQDVLSSITHIGVKEINIENYFLFPIYFIYSKILTSILGIGPFQTLNLGFFSLLLTVPVYLSLFYKRNHNIEHTSIYFITPALYLTLSWYFINDQYVPQFLGLVYLFILFGLYVKYQKERNPLFILLMVIFYALAVFTHPFVHIFFLIMIILEIPLSKFFGKGKQRTFTPGIIISFFAILVPYIGVYFLMLGNPTSETWWLFQRIVSERGTIVHGVKTQPLFNLIPRIYDQVLSPITKYVLFAAIFILAIGFLFYFFKKRKLFDLNLFIASSSWFVLGLTNLVLGQRALQIAMLPLARHFKYHHKLFSHLSKIIVVIILIAPSLYIANNMVNSSISGDIYIMDSRENLLGRFVEKHVTNETVILKSLNPYPTSLYLSESGKKEYRKAFGGQYGYEWKMIDIVLDTPKLQKKLMYLNITLPREFYDSVVYDNEDLEMIVYQIGM